MKTAKKYRRRAGGGGHGVGGARMFDKLITIALIKAMK